MRQHIVDLELPRSRRVAPQQLGEYRIERVLGSGGMATVYLARRLRPGAASARSPSREGSPGEPFALKVIAPHLAHDRQAVARFVAEAKAVCRIHHPNVVRIVDFGQLADGTLFQVMELLDGHELTRLMGQRMSAWKAQPIVHQICMGLQAAHDQGVVHRDLKPNNVLVLHGEPLTLKLLDFGIAKLLDPDDSAKLTVTGAVLGTPLFMAPEQVLGRRELIGPQTDLYSLGVIIYTMLCGKPPFCDEAMGLVMMRHVEDSPPALREREPDVPEAVARLVHRCLEKNPARRPASARQLAVEFAKAVNEAETAPTGCWREHQRAIHDTWVDADAKSDTVVDPPPAVNGATEPHLSRPDVARTGEATSDERWDAVAGAPPSLITSRIPRHPWVPLVAIAASLGLLLLALALFVWLVWGPFW